MDVVTADRPRVADALTYYRRLAAVVRYVEAHGSEPVSLRDAARVAGLEPKYFSAFFRSKVGTRFSEWIRAVRVERAVRLMRASDTSITRLAFEVGFGEVRTFQRAFKRLVGATPSAYRASVRPESRRMSRCSGISTRAGAGGGDILC